MNEEEFMHAAVPTLKHVVRLVFVQSIHRRTVLVFGTHQGSQQTMLGKSTYTMRNSMQYNSTSQLFPAHDELGMYRTSPEQPVLCIFVRPTIATSLTVTSCKIDESTTHATSKATYRQCCVSVTMLA